MYKRILMVNNDYRGLDNVVSPTKRNRTTSSANYESTPSQVDLDLDFETKRSSGARFAPDNSWGFPARCRGWTKAWGSAMHSSKCCKPNNCYPTYHITFQAAALAGDLEPADLVGAVLGEVLVGLPTLQEQVSLQNLTLACYQVLRCSTLSAATGVKDKRSTLVARELPSLLSPLFSQVFGTNLSPF